MGRAEVESRTFKSNNNLILRRNTYNMRCEKCDGRSFLVDDDMVETILSAAPLDIRIKSDDEPEDKIATTIADFAATECNRCNESGMNPLAQKTSSKDSSANRG